MPIREYQVKVGTTGSAASATGSNGQTVSLGELVAVYLDFSASAPNTTDTTITSTGDGAGVGTTLLTITNSNADAWYFPGEKMDDNVGSEITGAYQHPIVFNHITIALAGSDPLAVALTAYLYVKS